MTFTTPTSRECDRDAVHAVKAARADSVFATDRGRLAHVLSRLEDDRNWTGRQARLAETLAPDFDFTPPLMKAGFRNETAHMDRDRS